MKKKVIFVTTALWIGGIETALVNLLNHLDYRRYEVTVLILRAELDMANRINPNCRLLIADREKTYSFSQPYKYVRFYHLTEESEQPSGLHQIMMWTVPAIKWMENRLYIRYIHKLMKNEYFDTCIVYSDEVSEIAIKSIRARKYLMFYHHGVMRHKYHDQIAYQKCEKIIAVSNNQAMELKKFVPEVANKIISIHNLIDVDEIRTKSFQSITLSFDEAKFNIVSVGRVSHEKGMDIAVRTCAKLVQKGHDNVRWWIVGDGPAMQEVKNTIKECNMEKYVIIVGMQKNPYPYIRQADLYVQPSRFEGYPMTILEALVLGHPVVSTNNNGAKEIIEDGVTGVLCQMDSSVLADVIERLICNRDYLEELRKNVQSLDFLKQNQQYVDELEKLL